MNSNIVYMWIETKLHLWSVRYQDGLFDFWRESCIKILPDFEDRMVYLQQLVQFCWNTKVINTVQYGRQNK